MGELRRECWGEDVEVCGGLEEVVLVVGGCCGEGVQGVGPEGAGGGVGGVDGFKGGEGGGEEVGGVGCDDGFEVREEEGGEGVDGAEAEEAAFDVLFGEAGGGPLEEVGEDGAEGGVVEFVDHLDGDGVDEVLDLGDFVFGDLGAGDSPLAAQVKGGEEDGGEDWRVLGHGGLGVLVDGGAQNIEILANSLFMLARFKIPICR